MTKPKATSLFTHIKAALDLCETQYQRDSVLALLANLFPDESVADKEIPIEDHGTAMPFARDAAAGVIPATE